MDHDCTSAFQRDATGLMLKKLLPKRLAVLGMPRSGSITGGQYHMH